MHYCSTLLTAVGLSSHQDPEEVVPATAQEPARAGTDGASSRSTSKGSREEGRNTGREGVGRGGRGKKRDSGP